MKAPLIVAVVLLAAVFAQAGCSFLFLEGPPARDEIPFRHSDDTYCTESNGKPVADIITAGVLPLYLVILMIGHQGPTAEETGSDMAVTIWLSSILAASGVFTASSIWGFYTTHKCRQYADRLNGPGAR